MNYKNYQRSLYLFGCYHFLTYGGLDDFLVKEIFGGNGLGYPIAACLIVGLGYSSFLLWWEQLDRIFGILFPRIPGYCYTCLFEVNKRAEVAWRLGFEPRWIDIQNVSGIDQSGKYAYRPTPKCEVMHIYPDKEGETVSELTDKLKMFRCGGKDRVPFSPFYTLVYIHQAARCFIWFVAIWNQSFQMILALLIGATFIRYVGLNLFIMNTILIGFIVDRFTVLQKIFLIVSFLLASKFANYISMNLIRRRWKAGNDKDAPEPESFPDGLGSSNRQHNYDLENMNPNYTATYFKEDGGITGEERELFMEQTGLTNTETYKTGNPHKVPAQFARYFKWHWSNRDEGGAVLTFNIGGTFRGWPCTVAGVSLQPKFSDSDSAHLAAHGSAPGRGQLVIDDWLSTDCGPVGGGPNSWSPNLNVDGIGGATIWMTHCYDIPIKALIGAAYENNTKTCYVNLHSCPAIFTDTSGALPLTKQAWRHEPDGYTEWRWVDKTSGTTWRHNTRIYYEHFFTDYIQTDDKTWYVSDIYRQVGDLYLIRWTRTDIKPIRTPKRQICVQIPQGMTNLPLYKIKNELGVEMVTIEFVQSLKTFEEYVHSSKSFEALQVNLRALTDNYHRQKGLRMDFLNHADVLGIWKAEMLRRNLIDLTIDSNEDAPLKDVVLRIFGFKPDPRSVASVVDELLSLLKRQPIREVSRPTLVQDTPYVKIRGDLKKIKVRTTPLPKYQGNGESLILSQESLDRNPPTRVMELSSQSETIQGKICQCIFGRDENIGMILPCGNPHNGGSYLSSDTTKLLLTEIEYTIQKANVALIVDVLREQDKREIYTVTNTDNEDTRKAIIRIAEVEPDTWNATRIHYGSKTDYKRIMTVYGSHKFKDLIEAAEDIQRILNNDADLNRLQDRRYIAHPNGENLWRAVRTGKLTEKILKQNNGAVIGNLRAVIRNDGVFNPDENRGEEIAAVDGPFQFQMLNFNGVDNYSQIPIIENNDPWCRQYDGAHWIDGCQYPPAHYYADREIDLMRQLKKPG
jgi:hypothetical protein